MVVGPSAAPMIPIEEACGKEKPRKVAPIAVAKIPNCAAAANSITDGRRINGAKSHIAPIAMKISTGNSSFAIPALYRVIKKPSAPGSVDTAEECGMFARMAPKPIGRSRAGS